MSTSLQNSPDEQTYEEKAGKINELIRSQKLDNALQIIETIPNSDENQKGVILIYRAIVSLKQRDLVSACKYSQEASELLPKEILPYKLQFYSNMKSGIETKISILKRALKNSKPDLEFLILFASIINKIAAHKPSVSNLYFDAIKKDSCFVAALHYISPSKNTVNQRVEILKNFAESDVEYCSLLVNILVKEINDINGAAPYVHFLPKENPTRIHYNILFKQNPIKHAKFLSQIQKTNTNNSLCQHFDTFVKAYENNDLIALQRFVQKEPLFVSGWILLAEKLEDPQSKLIALNEAKRIHPHSKIVQNLLGELTKESIAVQKEGSQKVVYTISEDEKKLHECDEIWTSYMKSKDKELLKPLLELKNILLFAPIKTKVIYELKEEIGKEEFEKHFSELIETKCNLTYYYLGKYELENGNEEKATGYFLDAVSNGSVENEALDFVSRKLISENKLEEAIEICKRVDCEWAHLRSGLIWQRLGRYEEARAEFIKITSTNKNLAIVWDALAQCHLSANRILALEDTLEKLRELKSANEDFESEASLFYGKRLPDSISFEKSPIQYHNYIQQNTSYLRSLRRTGRIEACKVLIDNSLQKVSEFVDKWNNLSAVLKSVADYYLEAFIITHDQLYSGLALKMYKKRAESDIRAESFVDIANLFHLIGNDEAALTVLQKVLKKFPDSTILWTNLGVAYALLSKFPFARHCFIVASKIGTPSQNGKVYSYIASIGIALRDAQLMKESIAAAENSNPFELAVWQLKNSSSNPIGLNLSDLNSKLDCAFSLYESGETSKNLPVLCLKRGQYQAALGFAMLNNDNEAIALSLEALKKYDTALCFAQDDETKKRLISLCQKDYSNYPGLELYQNSNIDAAIDAFKSQNDPISIITAASLLISEKKHDEAYELLLPLKDKRSPYQQLVLAWLLEYTPKKIALDDKIFECDPLIYLLRQKRRGGKACNALNNMRKRFIDDPRTPKIFVTFALTKFNDDNDISSDEFKKMIIEEAEKFGRLCPGRESTRLLIAAYCNAQEWAMATKMLQMLYLLDPNQISKTKSFFDHLNEKYRVPKKSGIK